MKSPKRRKMCKYSKPKDTDGIVDKIKLQFLDPDNWFSRLPFDIFQIVVKFLNTTDYLNFSSISKEYRELLTKVHGYYINDFVKFKLCGITEDDCKIPNNNDKFVFADSDERNGSIIENLKDWTCFKNISLLLVFFLKESVELFEKLAKEFFKNRKLDRLRIRVYKRVKNAHEKFRNDVVKFTSPNELNITDPLNVTLGNDLNKLKVLKLKIDGLSKFQFSKWGFTERFLKKQTKLEKLSLKFKEAYSEIKWFNYVNIPSSVTELKVDGSMMGCPKKYTNFTKTLTKLHMDEMPVDLSLCESDVLQYIYFNECSVTGKCSKNGFKGLKSVEVYQSTIDMIEFLHLIRRPLVTRFGADAAMYGNKKSVIKKVYNECILKRRSNSFGIGRIEVTTKKLIIDSTACISIPCTFVASVQEELILDNYTIMQHDMMYLKALLQRCSNITTVRFHLNTGSSGLYNGICKIITKFKMKKFIFHNVLIGLIDGIPPNVQFHNLHTIKEVFAPTRDIVMHSTDCSESNRISNVTLNKLCLYMYNAAKLNIRFINVKELYFHRCHINEVRFSFSNVKVVIFEGEVNNFYADIGCFIKVTVLYSGFKKKIYNTGYGHVEVNYVKIK